MGIMQNKVSRRIALGSIAGGLAGSVAVISALKARYHVNLPTSNPAMEDLTWGGHSTRRVYGRNISIDIPRMRIRNSADAERYVRLQAKVVGEQTYKDLVKLSERERQALVAEFVEQKIKEWKSQIDKVDSHSLWDLLSGDLDKREQERFRNELAKMTDEEKARQKKMLKSQLSEGLAKWRGGEGQKKFEQHMYNELFTPPKSLTEEQQLRLDRQIARQRLERLRNGTFETSIRRSFEDSYQELVKKGRFPSDRVKLAVEQASEAELKLEREWAAKASNTL